MDTVSNGWIYRFVDSLDIIDFWFYKHRVNGILIITEDYLKRKQERDIKKNEKHKNDCDIYYLCFYNNS